MAEQFRRVTDAATPSAADADRKVLVLQYLDAGAVLQAARGRADDRIDPSRTRVVPVYVATDGHWVWTGDTEYYLREHDVWPEQDFVDEVARRGGTVPEVSAEVRAQALEWSRNTAG